jgi:hypothetical protein
MKAKAIGVPLLVLVGAGIGYTIGVPSLAVAIGVLCGLAVAIGILVSGKE